MPYVSRAQQGYFHSPEGMKKVGPAVVAEFDQASKGQSNLPAKAPQKKPLVPTAAPTLGVPMQARSAMNYGALVSNARRFA